MHRPWLVTSLLAVGASLLLVVPAGSVHADPAPRPDPWIQGQIDAQTEDVAGFLNAINIMGIDRSGMSDPDLVVKGHLICQQVYSGRGDISGSALPHTRPSDYHTMELVEAASVKYLCPPAAKYIGQDSLDEVP
ncbi:DUF732 domain-containing protein [Nocardia sp. AB354]|uniref:DUF732 domain-containing protein n=1 Tax=Nocardia sp. AB354 TaxID=3413283 RepID=UPI003C1A9C57